ncbi:AIPR family protein [Dolichospermum compactum]|uniref:Abortive phage infection protein C-terminal domain-containing protein n=1 Tax=Dolichospermum compactum NIES-806 TaxID=1973481 RepID=A0A1Z4V1U3_9CYAN|nr:AIPR family protein [Dolichospermum compactum]BAZ85458.1 hypothetical protein NIES806_16610 [Dolichospermum compactum NIES-806]
MDRITEAYLNDFQKEYSYPENIEKPKLFEYFVNHCIVSRLHSERFEVEDVSVGGSGDMAFDGAAIIVNNNLVFSKEEIDDLKNRLHGLDVKFVFIQSKTSSKFDSAEIGSFIFGVESFFKHGLPKHINESIKALRDLTDYIYEQSIDFVSNPSCLMYYVTNGRWENDSNLVHRIDAGIETLKKTELFESSKIEFIPIDADNLKIIYKELKNKVDKQINFEKHTIIPQIDGVSEAYIGILPCDEYLKLICSSDGSLLKSLFYDNVRDFQGDNPVNREVSETLRNNAIRNSFVLLNNGVTIVAKSIQKTGSVFTIRDFQIVNGCQTSHILHDNKASLDNSIYLPIKLIVTNDEEVTNRIIKATNRQTEVKTEAFLSLQPFQKALEDFYNSFTSEEDKEYRLYYERRSKQYENQILNKSKVVSITYQIKCFVSMFLDMPHSTHRYYGELLKANEDKIFVETHSFYPYYISCLTCHLWENAIRSDTINQRYKKFRYHILMVIRILLKGADKSPLANSKKSNSYYVDIHKVLKDPSKVSILFAQAISIIDTVERSDTYRKYTPADLTRLKNFSTRLIQSAIEYKSKVINDE